MNEPSKQQHKNNSQESPCPICGQQNFIWGRTFDERPSGWMYFRADDVGWGGGEKLIARKCSNCANVQLFAC